SLSSFSAYLPILARNTSKAPGEGDLDLQQRGKRVLRLERYLEGRQVVARVDCCSSEITILADAEGGSIPAYEEVLSQKGSRDTYVMALDGRQYTRPRHSLVGFDEQLPEIKINELLASIGFSAEEIEEALDTFELRKRS